MKKMHLLFVFGIFLFSSTAIFCQAPTWQWGYGAGGAGNDIAYSISTDANGFSYVTGTFHATASFGSQTLTSAGNRDIFIAKYDAAGSCIWARSIGGPGEDFGYGIDIDGAGNCYFTGNYGNVVFTGKYDTNGNVVWISNDSTNNVGLCRSISVDASGNSWITGYLNGGTHVFGNYTINAAGCFVVKYDPNGNALFATKLGTGFIDLYGVANDNLGNAYLTGYLQTQDMIGNQTFTSTGAKDGILIKVDATGNFSWMRQSVSSPNSMCYGNSVCCDPQNGIYFTGWFDNTTSFGNNTLINTGCFVTKYDVNGNAIWAQQSIGSSSIPDSYSVTADQNSNIYIAGVYSNNLSFGAQQLNNNGTGANTYIAMFEPVNGTCQFAIPSTGQNPGAVSYGISTDNFGGTYIAGYSKGPIVFGTFTTQFLGGEDAFVAKIDNGKSNGIENKNIISATVYFSENEFHLSITDENVLKENPGFVLYDMTGRIVRQININAIQTTINSADLASGIYCWTIIGNSRRFANGKISVN
jgi:hypothetical protein